MTFPSNTAMPLYQRPYGAAFPTQQGLRRPQFQAVPISQAEKLANQQSLQNDDASIWRDTSLRYGGYADEVGEFLTPYLGKVGQFAGYGISTAYVMADMLTTLPRQFKNASPEFSTAKKSWQTAKEALDLGVFHAVATLLIPPMLIGSVVEATGHLLEKPQEKPNMEPRFSAVNSKKFANAAVHEESGGMRGLLDKGLAKLTSGIAPTTRQWAENSVDYLAKNVVTDGVYEAANKTVRGSRNVLGAIANGCAAIAGACNKVPGLSSVVGGDLVDTLNENAKSIKNFETFAAGGAKEAGKRKLASLLFLKPLPVAIGVGMVPLIAHPFDEMMLKIQDWTIRPLIGKNKIVKGPDGKYHSVRNPEFWGRKPQQATRPAAGASTPLKQTGPARFGVFQPATSPFATAGPSGFFAPFSTNRTFVPTSQTSLPIQ